MKKIIFFIIFFLLVILAPSADAITTTASDSSQPNRKEIVQERREKIAQIRQEFKTNLQEKRAEFKEKLEQLKDSRKKVLAQRADEKLAKVNKNSTERMSLAIGKLETLLEKFASRAATLKSEGKDTAEVDAAVVVARDAIADAKEAVATQAGKEYAADLSDETALKNNFGQTMSELRKDLNTTHEKVLLAKQKVMDVARALAKLKTPTPTI